MLFNVANIYSHNLLTYVVHYAFHHNMLVYCIVNHQRASALNIQYAIECVEHLFVIAFEMESTAPRILPLVFVSIYIYALHYNNCLYTL